MSASARFFAFAVCCLCLVVDSEAQYRQNDTLHASHGSFNDERASPNRDAHVELASGAISIEWGAPLVKERQVYGRLIPSGKVWRTGANEATVIHFDQDVVIEGKPLAAGNYALFTLGSEDEWTFIFNSVSQQWGAFTHDEEKDVLRVTVAAEEGEHQEELLFSFVDTTGSQTRVVLNWGTAQAGFLVSEGK